MGSWQSHHLNSRRMIFESSPELSSVSQSAAREYGRVVRCMNTGANRDHGVERKKERNKKAWRGGRGMQMRWYQERVIVGSPGAGQYRVFSSVREHSKHGATMAQNGRQLPDAALAALPLSHGEGHVLYQ